MARVFIIRLVILYTFIYNIPQRIYTQFLAHVFSLPSLVPILLIFFRCIRTSGLLANRRAGLLRLAVSPASLRGWRRRRLTPSHYIYPTCRLLISLSSESMTSVASVRVKIKNVYAFMMLSICLVLSNCMHEEAKM